MNILMQIMPNDVSDSGLTKQYAFVGIGVIVGLVLLYYVLKHLQKKYHPLKGDGKDSAEPITLESLADIYCKGMISKEEYLALKSTLCKTSLETKDTSDAVNIMPSNESNLTAKPEDNSDSGNPSEQKSQDSKEDSIEN